MHGFVCQNYFNDEHKISIVDLRSAKIYHLKNLPNLKSCDYVGINYPMLDRPSLNHKHH